MSGTDDIDLCATTSLGFCFSIHISNVSLGRAVSAGFETGSIDSRLFSAFTCFAIQASKVFVGIFRGVLETVRAEEAAFLEDADFDFFLVTFDFFKMGQVLLS